MGHRTQKIFQLDHGPSLEMIPHEADPWRVFSLLQELHFGSSVESQEMRTEPLNPALFYTHMGLVLGSDLG